MLRNIMLAIGMLVGLFALFMVIGLEAVNAVFMMWAAILFSAVYLTPAIIAVKNRKKHAGIITAINLVFGWTGIGFAAAMTWALKKDK